MPIIKWGHLTEIVPVNWLWKPFIPYGKVTIVEGDPGEGKTTLILTIAAMLSNGQIAPSLVRGNLVNEPDCSPANVFYLTNEDEVADTSLVRYLRAGGIASRFAYSAELQEHMTLTEENLLTVIADSNCHLLIVDPFQSFLPEGTSIGSITKMRTVFTSLSNVAKKTGVAVVLVGHLNKSEGSKDIHRGFGSADIAAAVRSILMVEMSKNNRELRWVRSIKCNFDESDYTPIRLVLDEDRKLSFAEFKNIEPEQITSKTKIEKAKQILIELLKTESMTIDAIFTDCDAYGIGDRTVRRAARELGIISRSSENGTTWELPRN